MNKTPNKVLNTSRPRMIKNMVNKILAISLATLSTQALADSTYIGIDYMLSNIELAGEKAKPSAVIMRAGVSNNNMAFEAQYLLGNTDDIYRMTFDLEQSAALFFVMQSDIIDGFGLDISLGYAMTEMTVSGPEETYNGTDNYNGFAWGIAIHQQIPFLEQVDVKLAYQSLYKDSNIDITGISLGFTYNF